jgi:hypothetical protein
MEYMAHVKHLKTLEEGKKVVLTLRDLTPGVNTKYKARVVRAEVSRKPENLKNWDSLRAFSVVGYEDPQLWAVKVIEELGLTVPGKPYDDIYPALAKL